MGNLTSPVRENNSCRGLRARFVTATGPDKGAVIVFDGTPSALNNQERRRCQNKWFALTAGYRLSVIGLPSYFSNLLALDKTRRVEFYR